jgi:hypothetical protein
MTGMAVAAASLCVAVPAAHAVTTTSSLTNWEANVGTFSQTALFPGSGISTITSIPLALAGSANYANPTTGSGQVYYYGTGVPNATSTWPNSWGTGVNTDIVFGASTYTAGVNTANISISKTSDYGFGFFLQPFSASIGGTEAVTINLLGSKGSVASSTSLTLSSSNPAVFFGYFGDLSPYVSGVQIITADTCGKAGTTTGPCAVGIGDFFESASAAPVPAPEPATLAVLGSGLVGIGLMRRRRAAKAN